MLFFDTVHGSRKILLYLDSYFRIAFPKYFQDKLHPLIDRVSVIVGILALVMGSAAVYGILSVNATMQAKPDQVNMPDYTGTLGSMKAQVDSINSQMGSLGSKVSSISSQVSLLDSQLGSIKNNMSDISALKTNVADIHEKLADLENMKTSIDTIEQKLNGLGSNDLVQQVDSTSGTITISFDKTSYLPGNTVHITAIGADPLKVVQIQLLDSNGVLVTSQNTWADSTGSVHDDLVLSSTLYPGSYQVKLVSDNATGSGQLTVTTTNTTPTGSYLFTAQTDKGFYQQGDMVQVSGMTQPGTIVSATMSSPSGKSFTSSTTANSDGTYSMSFSVLSYYESGPWNIVVNSVGQTRTISVYLESGGANSYAFTANTDKTSYNLGDTVQVSGTAQPASTVNAVMTSPSGSTYSSSSTAGSDGSYGISFATQSSYQQGSWSITVTSLGQTKTLYFTLGGSSGSSTFTAQTDKTTYSGGDIVQVAGSASPGSAVSEVLVSPSGSTYDSSATTNSYGSYVMFFSTTASYPKGGWYIDVSNQGQSKVLSFTLQ